MSPDLKSLPKAHLHLHLDGAMRPDTLLELAGAAGLPVPIIKSFGSFADFSETLIAAQGVLKSPEDLARLVREVIEDAAADGAVWVEPSVWPGFLRGRLGTEREVMECVLDAAAEAAAELEIGVGLMVAANRDHGPESAVELAELAASLADSGVVAFGLDGDEATLPPAPFASAFGIARDAGLLSTPHAGELAGPASVREARDLLLADRILHGVRAVEDEELLTWLADQPVCLDVCPTSNVMLSVVAAIEGHPLPALMKAGVRCTINADDPLLFGVSLLGEYKLCRDTLGLTDSQLAAVARASLEFSGAPLSTVTDGVHAIERWLAGTEAVVAPSGE